ncbi:hypothetical protein ACUODJ_44685, partial [Escherichia sp. HC-CC]
QGRVIPCRDFLPGGNSPYVSEQYRDDLLAQFPQARAHVIAGAGHWVHAEKPDAVLRANIRRIAARDKQGRVIPCRDFLPTHNMRILIPQYRHGITLPCLSLVVILRMLASSTVMIYWHNFH